MVIQEFAKLCCFEDPTTLHNPTQPYIILHIAYTHSTYPTQSTHSSAKISCVGYVGYVGFLTENYGMVIQEFAKLCCFGDPTTLHNPTQP